jgi:hypothetical protein
MIHTCCANCPIPFKCPFHDAEVDVTEEMCEKAIKEWEERKAGE